MKDPFRGPSGIHWRRLLLQLDAQFDTFLFKVWNKLSRGIGLLAGFIRLFRMRGFRRIIFEIAGDISNFGAIGAIFMLILAVPAFNETKSDWRTKDDYSVTFYDSKGNRIGTRGVLSNDTIPLDDIPEHLILATLATEDRRFFYHYGIDFIGLVRAAHTNYRAGNVVEGGSSLTQQLAKNLFLTNERTLERKITEAFLSTWLEFNLSKREILKLYLDRAYMGAGTYGVAAAASFYFDKPVTELSLAESAMLAGLYKAPGKYAPHVNLTKARIRANEVLNNMVEAGFLTDEQILSAKRNPATPVRRRNVYSPGYFLDYAFEEVKKMVPSGERILNVYTTLDTALQRKAEEATLAALKRFGKQYGVDQVAAAAVNLDGAVRFLVGGYSYNNSQFNRATDAQRQPGSSFKPFVYATAMMHGYTPQSIVNDAPIRIGNWSPQNYDRRFRGPISLTRGLVKSINTIPIRLARSIGLKRIAETTRAMGIQSPMPINLSTAIGSSSVTVLDMAGAYAAFANGGLQAKPFAIRDIYTISGNPVYSRRGTEQAPVRAISQKAAADINEILTQVPEWGTGRRARLEGIRMGGKTGTTNDYRDGWFIGYTGNFSTAIWFGNDNFTKTNRLTGGSLPAMTWGEIMKYAHKYVDLKPIYGFESDAQHLAKLSKSLKAATIAAQKADPKAVKPMSEKMSDFLAKMHRTFQSKSKFNKVTGQEAEHAQDQLGQLPG